MRYTLVMPNTQGATPVAQPVTQAPNAHPDISHGKPLVELGSCTLCSHRVYQVKGEASAPEVLRKPLRLHKHKKPYSIRVERPDDGEYRHWHDHVPWFVR